jgi:hypothetical protein
MKNPEALTFRIPRGLFRPVAGKLYIYMKCNNNGKYSEKYLINV